MIDTSKGNNFQESLEKFGGLGLCSRHFSVDQPASITQSCRLFNASFFERMNKGQLKMVTAN